MTSLVLEVRYFGIRNICFRNYFKPKDMKSWLIFFFFFLVWQWNMDNEMLLSAIRTRYEKRKIWI